MPHTEPQIFESTPTTSPLPPLDTSIFNKSLFDRILKFWFAELPDNATAASPQLMFKWFGRVDPESKAKFDASCRDLSAEALASIGPDRLQLPPYQGYTEERSLALHISAPFRDIIQRCSNRGDITSELRPADMALAMMLLLDQMPRNIFRKDEELGAVFTHYDRLARALLYCILHPQRADGRFNVHGLDRIDNFKYSPAYGCFFYVALQHSEALEDHDQFDRCCVQQLEGIKEGDVPAEKFIKAGIGFARAKRDMLEKFGRYPYRNKALGRESTAEEEKHLKEEEEKALANKPIA